MPGNSVKRIAALASLLFLSFLVFYSTSAKTGFFRPPRHDKIDLKVDSDCHYYQYDPQNPEAINNIDDLNGYVDVGCFFNGKKFGTWEETDLGCKQKFFNFSDLKPGDRGEDTVSLHVHGADACGQIQIENIRDLGNTCLEPETESADTDCENKPTGARERDGEMRESLELKLWLDQGQTPGFQGNSDPGEGDNIFNEKDVLISDWKNLKKFSLNYQIRKHLRLARRESYDICQSVDSDGDGKTNYGPCQGLARDGRMVASTVYYYGFAWRLPNETGNEAQGDSLSFTLKFTAVPNSMCSPCPIRCRSCDDNCQD